MLGKTACLTSHFDFAYCLMARYCTSNCKEVNDVKGASDTHAGGQVRHTKDTLLPMAWVLRSSCKFKPITSVYRLYIAEILLNVYHKLTYKVTNKFTLHDDTVCTGSFEVLYIRKYFVFLVLTTEVYISVTVIDSALNSRYFERSQTLTIMKYYFRFALSTGPFLVINTVTL